MDILEAKARNYQKVKAALYGKNDLIKTWGIITAENPMAYSYSEDENKKRDQALRKYLASDNQEYIKVKGKYRNPEKPLFLINPSLSDMKRIATRFGQESFIFAVNTKDNDEFSFDAGFYKISAPSSDKEKFEDPNFVWKGEPFTYNKSISKDRIINQKDADDFFTSIEAQGRIFKFQIPFFESTIRRAYERMSLFTEGKDTDQVQYDLMRITSESCMYTESGKWRLRGSLYR